MVVQLTKIPYKDSFQHKVQIMQVIMGNRAKVPVEAIETFRLPLDIRIHLDLLETLFVPYVSKNLVLITRLNNDGFKFIFPNNSLKIFKLCLTILFADGCSEH